MNFVIKAYLIVWIACMSLGFYFMYHVYETFADEPYSENIEYCQYVYMSWQNPLNENCNMEEIENTLHINY